MYQEPFGENDITKILEEFDRVFFNKLQSNEKSKRGCSFRKIFQYLMEKQQTYYEIVETGSCRINDNWGGDGMSTILFDWFINKFDGVLSTVDIDIKATEMARKHCTEKTIASNLDSVRFLWNYKPKASIDLLYLDSYDIDVNDPHPSAFHQMKELSASMRHLRRGCIVMIDDVDVDCSGVGKGIYVEEFMKDIGAEILFKDYQAAWVL